MTSDAVRPGPIEDARWPDRIVARVVAPGPPARIHGYDVEGDLAVSYGFGEVVLLLLTGEALPEATGRLFEAALVFLSPITVGEAPTHAAVLTRAVGSSTASVLAAGASTLARAVADEAERLVAALAAVGADGPPPALLAADGKERALVDGLRRLAERAGVSVPELAVDVGLLVGVAAVLRACGLAAADRIAVALMVSRLPAMAAEALASPRLGFLQHPCRLPDYRYEPPPRR
jgi:hypothetical protein